MQKTVNYRLFAWRIGLICALFLAGFLIVMNQLNARRGEEEGLRMKLMGLEEENVAMDAELKLVDTEDYIVSSAMTNFAFMNKNDLRFRFTNPEALYAYTTEELKILMDELAESD